MAMEQMYIVYTAISPEWAPFTHKDIYYEKSDGSVIYMRGAPGSNGNLVTTIEILQQNDPFLAQVRSWELDREVVATGVDLSLEAQKIIDELNRIDSQNIPYINDDTNSNWAADKALLKAGLDLPQDDNFGENWSPGSIHPDHILTRGSDNYQGGDSFMSVGNSLSDECFPAHTLITMADGGTKPISEMQIGNSVLAFDGAGVLQPRKVSKLFTNVTEHFYKLSSSDLKEDLVVTSGHRFALPEGGFETIEAILQRDGRIVLENGDVVIVIGELLEYGAETAHLFEQITLSKHAAQGALAAKPQEVTGWKTYTFEVEELHSYEAANDNTLIRRSA